MNILDENIPSDERRLLQKWGIPSRQIGIDIGRAGMIDEQIIPFLLQLHRPTFFTRDVDFYQRQLCHAEYSLIYLVVTKKELALSIRRLLRYPDFNTEAKRMGAVIRVAPTGLTVWRLHAEQDVIVSWRT